MAHFHNTFPSDLALGILRMLCRRRAGDSNAAQLSPALSRRTISARRARSARSAWTAAVPWPAVAHACYRDSRPATAAVSAMLTTHRALGTWQRKVDVYVALSEFARNKFIQGGLPEERIVVKPNSVDIDVEPALREANTRFLSGDSREEKGLRVLIDAWSQSSARIPLRIAGDGPLRLGTGARGEESRPYERCLLGELPTQRGSRTDARRTIPGRSQHLVRRLADDRRRGLRVRRSRDLLPDRLARRNRRRWPHWTAFPNGRRASIGRQSRMGVDASRRNGRNGPRRTPRIRKQVCAGSKLRIFAADLRSSCAFREMRSSAIRVTVRPEKHEMDRVNILGVGVSAIDMEMAVSRIEGWLERREQNYVIAVPAHCIVECLRSEKLRKTYNHAGHGHARWPSHRLDLPPRGPPPRAAGSRLRSDAGSLQTIGRLRATVISCMADGRRKSSSNWR